MRRTSFGGRRASLLALIVCLALAGVAALPRGAWAEPTHLQIGEIDGSQVEGGFNQLAGMDVDAQNGELLVTEKYPPSGGRSGVFRFDSSGSYEPPQITGAKTPQEEFSAPQDVAGDAAAGRVYVADSGNNRIDAFDDAGNLVAGFGNGGQLDGSTTPLGSFSSPCGVAVDPVGGDVYVGDSGNGRVWIFDSAGVYRGQVFDSSLAGPCGLGFDSNGDLFVNNTYTRNVIRFNRTGPREYFYGGIVLASRVTGLTLDSSDDHLFVTEEDPPPVQGERNAAEYDTNGALVSRFGVVAADSTVHYFGIAVDPADGRAYLNGEDLSESHFVRVFGPLVTVPDVTTGEATEVTDAGTATLNGTVDPDGIAITECEFEYGTDTSYGQTAACEPAAVGSGEEPVAVTARITCLSRGPHHFRLVAGNEEGSNSGADASFAVAEPPSIVSESAAPTYTDATLRGTFRTGGAATTYYFEYGPTDSYGSRTSERTVGGSPAEAEAEAQFGGLVEAASYHYRLVVRNSVATVTGPDQTFSTFSRAFGSCPNEAIRRLQSVPPGPFCRAYEQVTPVEKGTGRVRTEAVSIGIASGERLAYSISSLFPGLGDRSSPKVARYLAVRGPEGWTNHSLQPPSEQPANPVDPSLIETAIAESEDGTEVVVGSNRALAPGAIDGNTNLYLQNVDTGALTLIITTADEGFSASNLSGRQLVLGGSPDFSRIYFASPAALEPGDPSISDGPKVYEWSRNGGIQLVSVAPKEGDPGGDPVPVVGNTPYGFFNPVSRDGRRVAYTAQAVGAPQFEGVFLREVGRRDLIPVSASQIPGASPGAHPASLLGCSPDGNKVIFVSREPLTVDAPPAANARESVYSYDVSSGRLTWLATLSAGIEMRKISNDGEYVYVTTGLEESLLHSGHTTFVQKTKTNSASNFAESYEALSPNGRFLAFTTMSETNGRSNVAQGCVGPEGPLSPEGHCRQLYLFDAADDSVQCVSCGPGAEPLHGYAGIGNDLGNRTQSIDVPRAVLDDGAVYFDTPQALSPFDANDLSDVYEYQGGEARLISRGAAGAESKFAEVSADGSSVFFDTDDQVVAQDVDQIPDVYVARAGGGIAAQNVAPASAGACDPMACPPTGSSQPPRLSQQFGGPGNVKPTKACTGRKKSAGKARGSKARASGGGCRRRHARHHGKRHRHHGKKRSHRNAGGKAPANKRKGNGR